MELVSVQTINRYLEDIGYKARIKTTVPFITKKNQEKRVEWA